jgi:hypothetical protein
MPDDGKAIGIGGFCDSMSFSLGGQKLLNPKMPLFCFNIKYSMLVYRVLISKTHAHTNSASSLDSNCPVNALRSL